MAAKEEQDQGVAHMAFKIHNFWPHNPNTWFRQLESKFRICHISQSSMKYEHLLSALPTEVCSNINDSFEEINAGTTSLLVRELSTATSMSATEKTRKGSGGHCRIIADHRHLVDTTPSPTPTEAVQLILLKDSHTHSKYLVDTGTYLSLFPFRSTLPSSGPKLTNANGKTIVSWKFAEKTLHFQAQFSSSQ
jgi:hypothetical protein